MPSILTSRTLPRESLWLLHAQLQLGWASDLWDEIRSELKSAISHESLSIPSSACSSPLLTASCDVTWTSADVMRSISCSSGPARLRSSSSRSPKSSAWNISTPNVLTSYEMKTTQKLIVHLIHSTRLTFKQNSWRWLNVSISWDEAIKNTIHGFCHPWNWTYKYGRYVFLGNLALCNLTSNQLHSRSFHQH